MKVFVKCQTGLQTIFLENGAGVHDLKVAVSDATFIPGAIMRFTSPSLGNLEGKLSLKDLGIQEDDTLDLCMNVVGGMRAKWRKKRMRRLRRKRRKMRQRAR